MFELVAIAIFGPMIFELIEALACVVRCEAGARLRASSLISLHNFSKVGTVHRATLA